MCVLVKRCYFSRCERFCLGCGSFLAVIMLSRSMVEDYSVCSVSHFVCLRRTLNCRSIEIAMQVEQAVISHVRIHRTEALFYSTMKHNCMTRLTTIATQAVDRIHDCTLKVLRGKFWWLLSTDKVIDIFRWRTRYVDVRLFLRRSLQGGKLFRHSCFSLQNCNYEVLTCTQFCSSLTRLDTHF